MTSNRAIVSVPAGKRDAGQPLIEHTLRGGRISQVCSRGGKICPVAPVQPVKIASSRRLPAAAIARYLAASTRRDEPAAVPAVGAACGAACPDGTGAEGGPPAHPAVINTAQPATATAAMARAPPHPPTTPS